MGAKLLGTPLCCRRQSFPPHHCSSPQCLRRARLVLQLPIDACSQVDATAEARTSNGAVPSHIMPHAFANHAPSTEKASTKKCAMHHKWLLLVCLGSQRHVRRLPIHASAACACSRVELRNCTGSKDIPHPTTFIKASSEIRCITFCIQFSKSFPGRLYSYTELLVCFYFE